MATARERLLQALAAVISGPFCEEGKVSLIRLLNSYRVQIKPGENLKRNQTARDALADRIIDAWQEKELTDRKTLSSLISAFRMQLKQRLTRSRQIDSKRANRFESETQNQSKSLSRSQIKKNSLKHENAYFRDNSQAKKGDKDQTVIAGGPKQKSNLRGQCPKCRSMGIVLSRSYGGDDYHSCIYCGYQAYLNDSDPKLDLPLAAELLGNAFSDPKLDDDE